MNIASQAISQDVLRDKYAQPGEATADDVRRRIAHALAQAEAQPQRAAWEARFLAAQQAGVIPAGRIAAAAGTELGATLVNCFVQPVGDSISHEECAHPPIYTALSEAAETLRLGGGVGYDFSRIRPRGALVTSTRSSAAGPVAFLHVFDASCRAIESIGSRRGAQMGVLRCDHPDIEAFVAAKSGGALQHFNLSVGVNDAFMHALDADRDFELVHIAQPGEAQIAAGARLRADGQWVYGRMAARTLWERIVACAHDHGEPGLLFLDRINADNNLGYCEAIAATNPCGEQPLPPYGACCLGALDLTRFVVDPFEPHARFDFARMREVIPMAVRMLDNVLDLTVWPLPQHEREARSKRRIGLGITGLGDALIMLGLRYDGTAALKLAADIARDMRDAAYAASCALARERGAFPLFEADGYLCEGRFASRLPEALKQSVREYGVRNSHLLCIAPAGSISLAFADNVSNGIEPVYDWCYLRHRRMRDARVRAYEVEDHAWRLYRRLRGPHTALPDSFVSAMELSMRAHLEMVAAMAPYVDGAISKTVNAGTNCTRGEFDTLYRSAWRRGVKGIAAFRPNGVLGGVLRTVA